MSLVYVLMSFSENIADLTWVDADIPAEHRLDSR